jgi:hypothetical protein
VSLPNFDRDKKQAPCLVCGGTSYISAVTGDRVHLHAPDEPHSAVIEDPEASP